VNLVEIDHFEGEATEAVFGFAPDRIGLQRYSYIALRVPAPAALSEDVGSRTGPALKGSANDFFRVSKAIDGSGINPVDAELEGAMDRRDGIIVVLRSPAKLPA